MLRVGVRVGWSYIFSGRHTRLKYVNSIPTVDMLIDHANAAYIKIITLPEKKTCEKCLDLTNKSGFQMSRVLCERCLNFLEFDGFTNFSSPGLRRRVYCKSMLSKRTHRRNGIKP